MSKIYKELIFLKSKYIYIYDLKSVEELNIHFSEEDIQLTNRYMKRR